MKTQFEQGLKTKLQSFEPEGATGNWGELQSKLPAQPKSVWHNILLVTGAAAILTSVVLFSVNKFNKKADVVENQPEVLVQNETVDAELNIVTLDTIVSDVIEDVSDSTQIIEQNDVNKFQTQENHAHEKNNESVKPVYVVREEVSEIAHEDNIHQKGYSEVKDSTETIDKENAKPETALMINVSVKNGCVPVEVKFTTTADPADYEFMWHFKDGTRSTDVAPVHKYTNPGTYQPVLILTPIKDNLQRQRVVASRIQCNGIPETKIDFEKFGNFYTFNTIDSGDIFYSWKIDSREFSMPLVEYEFKYDGQYVVELKMSDDNGCYQNLKKEVNVIIEHNYAMPNAFTPSSFGVNSTFGPVYDDMHDLSFTMIILDKYNQVVYETDDVNKPWDGINIHTNQEADAGVYLWKIVTKDRYGNVRTRRGQVTLLRD